MFLVDTSPTFRVDFGAASVGTVTVDITRSDGTLLVDDGGTDDNGDGTYDYTLSVANNDQLDRLKLDWTIVSTSEVLTTYEEIVGNLLFTIEEARARESSGQQTPISDTTNYPDPVIARMRELIAQQFEVRTEQSWIRRYARVEVGGSGSHTLSLAHAHPRDVDGNRIAGPGRMRNINRIISATVGGTAVATADLRVDGWKIRRTSGIWTTATTADPFNVIIEYEYGHDPVPLEANEEALRVCLQNLVRGDISAWAQTFSAEDGSISYPPGGLVWPPQTVEWFKRHPGLAVA